MKFKILIAIACAAVTESAAVTSADRETLIRSIAEANAQMPMSAGMLGTMTSATVSKDTIIYNMSLDEMITSMSNDSDKRPDTRIDKQYIIDQQSLMVELEPDMGYFYRTVSDCGMYLKLQYHNPRYDTYKSVTLTPGEMRRITVGRPDYGNLADHLIRDTQRGLPVTTSGLTITAFRKEGSDIVTHCTVDEDVASFETMKRNVGLMKDTYLQTLRNKTELTTVYSAYILAKAGYNQKCIYTGSQCGESISYSVTALEILDNLK